MKRTSRRTLREFTLVIERDEDGYYVASVPALHSCYTQACSLEELAPRIREVIALCLEESSPAALDIPDFVGTQMVEVQVG